jgi:hypothetical protein
LIHDKGFAAMGEEPSNKKPASASHTGKLAQKERLARKLRENLRKRKEAGRQPEASLGKLMAQAADKTRPDSGDEENSLL